MTSMMQLHGQYVIHIIMHVHAQVNLVQSRQKASCGAANTTPFWHVKSGFNRGVFRCSCDKHYKAMNTKWTHNLCSSRSALHQDKAVK